MELKCLVKRVDEETPDSTAYNDVREAFDRIKQRSELEGYEIYDYTIIPVEIYE